MLTFFISDCRFATRSTFNVKQSEAFPNPLQPSPRKGGNEKSSSHEGLAKCSGRAPSLHSHGVSGRGLDGEFEKPSDCFLEDVAGERGATVALISCTPSVHTQIPGDFSGV